MCMWPGIRKHGNKEQFIFWRSQVCKTFGIIMDIFTSNSKQWEMVSRKLMLIHSKNRIVILTIKLSCLLQMSEPIWCMDRANCQDGMRMWRKVGWEDCRVVLLHIVMNCVHSSESEITNCQSLWQFLFYSIWRRPIFNKPWVSSVWINCVSYKVSIYIYIYRLKLIYIFMAQFKKYIQHKIKVLWFMITAWLYTACCAWLYINYSLLYCVFTFIYLHCECAVTHCIVELFY